jgi:hypothetical protein
MTQEFILNMFMRQVEVLFNLILYNTITIIPYVFLAIIIIVFVYLLINSISKKKTRL